MAHTFLERQRGWVIVLTIALSVVSVLVLQGRPWSDGRTAAALDAVNLSLLIGVAVKNRDSGLARLLVFGLTFGVVEIVADALCVRFTHTLDYRPAHSPMLGLSPFWMPTAWAVVAVQIGWVGTEFIRRFGMAAGVTLTALLGAVNIPFYEEMAWGAHWWRYGNCHLWGHTPVYIIVAELLIGAALGPLAGLALHSTSWKEAARAGALGGLATILGGILGYGLVERVL